MSILKALQDYLLQYDQMQMQIVESSQPVGGEIQYRIIGTIQTDQTEENSSSYALSPTGNGKTSKDILGNRTYQNSYVFYAKESASNEIDRQENHDFLEDFSDWLEERNDGADFPTLPTGYSVEEIQVSNAMLFDLYEDGIGLYQIQIQLIFQKTRSD
jgi:hypothetical protein